MNEMPEADALIHFAIEEDLSVVADLVSQRGDIEAVATLRKGPLVSASAYI